MHAWVALETAIGFLSDIFLFASIHDILLSFSFVRSSNLFPPPQFQSLSFLHTNVKIINPEEEETDEIALGVLGSDSLYQEVRDQHVEKFGSFLQNQAKALQASHANFTNKEKKHDLSEIHQFVKQIPVSRTMTWKGR